MEPRSSLVQIKKGPHWRFWPIDYVEYMGKDFTCIMSVFRNDINFIDIFMFFKKNVARKGLVVVYGHGSGHETAAVLLPGFAINW